MGFKILKKVFKLADNPEKKIFEPRSSVVKGVTSVPHILPFHQKARSFYKMDEIRPLNKTA